MTRISQYSSLNGGTLNTNDIVPVVDVSDTTASAEGTTKNVTVGEIFDWYFPDGMGVPAEGVDIALLGGFGSTPPGFVINGTDTEAIAFGYGDNSGVNPTLSFGLLQTKTSGHTSTDNAIMMRTSHDEGDEEFTSSLELRSGLNSVNNDSFVNIRSMAPSVVTDGRTETVINMISKDETSSIQGNVYITTGASASGQPSAIVSLYATDDSWTTQNYINMFCDPNFDDFDGAGIDIMIDTTQGAMPFSLKDTGYTTFFWITPSGAVGFLEQADPAAPSSNQGLLYVRDNGSGKSQLCVRFATGAVQTIATEP